MTGEQLISTGILDSVFETLKDRRKTFWKKKIADYIAERFTTLLQKKPNKFEDPAKIYLKKLHGDYRKINRTETHRQPLAPVLNLIQTKIAICKEYIRLFRKPLRKNYYADLFFITIFNLLWPLKYEKRLEILSDLNTLSTSRQEYIGWKSRQLEDCGQASSAMRKRLQRIRSSTSRFMRQESFSVPYIKVQDMKRMRFGKIGLKSYPTIEANDIILNRQYAATNVLPVVIFKEAEKLRPHETHIKKQVKDFEKSFSQIQSKNLKYVIKKLKMPSPTETFNALMGDSEFIEAFRMRFPL